MVPCLTLTCYICAFQHCTSDYSLQALTHTIVWGSQCTATSFKLSYAANWTLDFSDMLFLTDCAIINLATDVHVGISIGTCHKKYLKNCRWTGVSTTLAPSAASGSQERSHIQSICSDLHEWARNKSHFYFTFLIISGVETQVYGHIKKLTNCSPIRFKFPGRLMASNTEQFLRQNCTTSR